MKERTYRYFTGDVLYPFGFGLSYTEWKVCSAEKDGNAVIAEISNIGKMDGDTVLQVYVRCDSPYAPVHPRLCGFKHVSVPAGEKHKVRIPLDSLTSTVVNEEGERVTVEKMTFYVGISQPDEKSVSMCGVQPVAVE